MRGVTWEMKHEAKVIQYIHVMTEAMIRGEMESQF